LRKPRVRKAIADYHARADITVERVLEEIRRVAFSRMGDFADWGPDGVTLRASQELTEAQAACVAEVADHTRTRVVAGEGGRPRVQVEDRQIRIKLHDKIEALRLAAKVLGLL
jgi:phage terminase small subunit